MMAIVAMTDAVAGQPASSAEYNKLIDNIQDLDARLGAVLASSTAHTRLNTLETRTQDTTTNGGHGNVQLSERLGTGVGTGSNVTTGSATSQLTDLRSRATTIEGVINNGTSGNSALNTRVAALEAASGSLPAPQAQYASGFVSTASTTAVALSGDPGIVLTVPASGRVIITAGGRSDTNNGQVMIEVKTGSTIGSGTVLLGADLNRSGDKGSRSWLVTGLTAGATINARVMYASASGTSGFAQRYIISQSVS